MFSQLEFFWVAGCLQLGLKHSHTLIYEYVSLYIYAIIGKYINLPVKIPKSFM